VQNHLTYSVLFAILAQAKPFFGSFCLRILHLQEIPTTTHSVYLALGSNLGERRGNLATALQRLCEVLDIETVSSIYETEPVGYLDQPRFLNMACYGKTGHSAQELLKYTQEIEIALGRQPTLRNGPRPIDIDILIYDNLHIQQEDLTLPHPRMAERAFVLAPLSEIAPDVVDPASGKTAQELLHAISQDGVVKLTSVLHYFLKIRASSSR
jgi:2-amino-4-hydroxy-6-hydroxymethyldihydropteridine diphosphokinase